MSFEREIYSRFEASDGVESALFAIAIAIDKLAYQVKYLGNGNASTQMGAIEAFSARLGEKLDRVASAIESVVP